MPLHPPNLDDTNYEELRDFALEEIESNLQVEWTDLSPGDPGIVLLEAFAYLTDQMIYRLNRLPDKVYVSLLRLLGVTLYPPVAAAVELAFSNDTETTITVPAGTRVTTTGGGDDAPVFITNVEIEVPGRDGETPGTETVWARHCVVEKDEVAGQGTGDPGLSVAVQHPPLVAPTRDGLDLRVETVENGRRVEWDEVPNFSNLSPDRRAFVVDRPAGIIRFAPAAKLTEIVNVDEEKEEARQSRHLAPLAAVPPKGAPIRVSYPHGGGVDGNVVAGVLATILPDPAHSALQQLAVTNPRPASGGQDMETLPEALARGPQEIYSLERAITARDFEQLAATGDGIARATAFTQAGRWRHGTRGTVEIHLVPQLPRPGTDVETVTAAKRAEAEGAWEIRTLRNMLADSQPLGTAVLLRWVNYKKVWVEAAVVIRERQSEAEARDRLGEALRALINPLGKEARTGRWHWDFGQPLYASDTYRVILDDPAVERVTRLNLCVAAAPDEDVRAIAADFHQPHTWYAGGAVDGVRTLFRSFNDGESWEAAPAFPPPDEALREAIDLIRPNPDHPGLVVAWAHQHDADGALHQALPFVTTNCGESWHELPAFASGRVEDVAWIARGDVPIMLLATDQGLYKLELTLLPGQAPAGRYAQVHEMPHPLYAVAVVETDGQVYVAVARKSRGGVYLANGLYLAYDIDLNWHRQEPEDVNAAATGPQLFQPLVGGPRPDDEEAIGLQDEDVRSLAVQVDEEHGRVFLWAGAMGTGWIGRENPSTEGGGNAYCWEVQTPQPLLGQWVAFPDWIGGSCRDVAFAGRVVLAATQWGGVLRLDTGAENPAWEQTNSVALPRRQTDVQRDFAPLTTLAANEDRARPLAIAGGAQGLYLTADGGRSFTVTSRTCFDYKVALPENWLFMSGDHVIETSTHGGAA